MSNRILNLNDQHGVGIIEVLVTVLVLATALLAITAMHVKSLEFNHSSYIKSQANILVTDITDRMRLNRPYVKNYTLSFADGLPTGTSRAEKDIAEWGQNLAALLPNGKGQIKCNAITDVIYQCTIGIKWNEAVASDSDPSTSENVLYYTSQI